MLSLFRVSSRRGRVGFMLPPFVSLTARTARCIFVSSWRGFSRQTFYSLIVSRFGQKLVGLCKWMEAKMSVLKGMYCYQGWRTRDGQDAVLPPRGALYMQPGRASFV